MPRKSQYTIAWCRDAGVYELAVGGQVARRFPPGDEAAWRSWLETATAFAFRGAAGDLGVYREAHPRGGAYWYAYRSVAGRTRKRYLGATTSVTFARLEAAARDIAGLAAATTAPMAQPRPGDPGLDAPPGADVAAAFPATKLAPPPPRAGLVDREHLLAALDAAATVRLMLVAAPAGWGKTTLLAAWARRQPARVAWLALEVADDSPARFWAAVVAALRARLPGVGATALALLRAPQPPALPVVVTALINDLAARITPAAPLALVLDDYHLVADPATRESVAYLVEHVPPDVRLILGTRSDPDLPLARLRARGQLAELRAADLGFSAAETAAFLGGALGVPLADDEVAALAARTEGWAAGLQLAALALRGRGDPAAWLAGFTGGHRFLLDYVEGEILARQPPAVRDFLLRAAVLGRLSADLCAAVTGEPASRDLLAGLERQNLFLVPLDEGRAWYRLHDLFREALLARAAREPGLLAAAHGRAAQWHAAHGDGRAAIEHTLAAGDHELAAALIAREAPAMWRAGEARAVLGWLLALPDAALWPRAALALDTALRALEAAHLADEAIHAAARAQVERLLTRLEDRAVSLGGSPPAGGDAAVVGRRGRLLRALLASRAPLARQDAASLARLAGEVAGLADGEAARWRLIPLALDFWGTFTLGGGEAALVPALEAAWHDALAEGDHLTALRATAMLDLIHTLAGRFGEAERVGEAGLALAARRDLHSHQGFTLYNSRAARLALQGRRAEAAEAAEVALAVGRTWQQLYVVSAAHRLLAHLALTAGDPAAAAREVDRADEALRRAGLTLDRALLGAYRAWCWLASGDLARAEDWAARAATAEPPPRVVERAEVDLMRARVALAGGHADAALATLDVVEAAIGRASEYFLLATTLALRLAALHRLGRGVEARAVAARALALTAPNDALRAYVDEGPPVEAALLALRDEPQDAPAPLPESSRAHLARILVAFADGRQGRVAPDPGASPGAAPFPRSTAPPPALVEPLTRREREVLRLLADGASNQEIADETAVALATAKKHVGNLLGKLGVGSRGQAVARARELGLL